MCRLFGFRSAVESPAHHSLVQARDALVHQAAAHPDGWGIGWFDGDDAYVVKTARAAVDCERFRRVTQGLRSHTLVAHLRRATVGDLDPLNAHPFRRGRWLFAHNGSIWGMEPGSASGLDAWLEAHTDPRLPAIGDTDSERLFHFLLTRLAAAGVAPDGRRPSDPMLVARVVREALVDLDRAARERELDRPLLNVILTDGRLFLAHRAGFELHLSTQKVHCVEAARCPAEKVCLLATRPADRPVNHLLVASEPTATDANRWEPIPDGATIVLDAEFRLVTIAPAEGWVPPTFRPEAIRAHRAGPAAGLAPCGTRRR